VIFLIKQSIWQECVYRSNCSIFFKERYLTYAREDNSGVNVNERVLLCMDDSELFSESP
jgi:hypothetical protein